MELQALKTFSQGGGKLVYQGETFTTTEARAKEYLRLGLASKDLTSEPDQLLETYREEGPTDPSPVAKSDYTAEELQEKKVSELKEIAKNIGVSGFSNLTKSQLIFEILAQQNQNNSKLEA